MSLIILPKIKVWSLLEMPKNIFSSIFSRWKFRCWVA